MGLDLSRFRAKRNDEWLDWLSDEPSPNKTRPQAGQQASVPREPVVHHSKHHQQSVTPSEPKTTAVSINIHVPNPDRLKRVAAKTVVWGKQRLSTKKSRLVAGSSVGVLAIALVGLAVIGGRSDDGPKEVLGENSSKPNFAYSLPDGKASNADGDVRFDAKRKVVNYKDTLAGVEITISQQPLPADLKTDTDNKVKKLAEGFSATKVLSTANPTAYLGTSVKGPQTVIFSKKDLLVFIQSTREIDEHDWAEYITSLR